MEGSDGRQCAPAQGSRRQRGQNHVRLVQYVNPVFDWGLPSSSVFEDGRYHHTLSAYPGLNDDDIEFEYRDLIISFFTHHYLGILHGAGYNVLYEHNARWENIKKQKFELSEDVEGSWWSLEATDRGGASSRETIQRAKMHGFDQVIAISQESINIQFSAQLASPSAVLLHSWAYEEFFSCHFKALSLSLLSNNRAIIWVHLTRGNLRPLDNAWKPCAE